MNTCADSVRLAHPLFQKESGGEKPTSALQLRVVEINVHLACKLNRIWHSRLPKIEFGNVVRNPESVCYGAGYDGTWYAVGIWSSPVARNMMKEGETTMELRRLAISQDAPRYTASRMLSIMVKCIGKKFSHINRLISYQDTEVHRGTIYRAAGWTEGKTSNGRTWSVNGRKRNKEQTMADKIRWEKLLSNRRSHPALDNVGEEGE